MLAFEIPDDILNQVNRFEEAMEREDGPDFFVAASHNGRLVLVTDDVPETIADMRAEIQTEHRLTPYASALRRMVALMEVA